MVGTKEEEELKKTEEINRRILTELWIKNVLCCPNSSLQRHLEVFSLSLKLLLEGRASSKELWLHGMENWFVCRLDLDSMEATWKVLEGIRLLTIDREFILKFIIKFK